MIKNWAYSKTKEQNFKIPPKKGKKEKNTTNKKTIFLDNGGSRFFFYWMGPNLFTLLKLIKANQYSIRPCRYM